MPAIALEGVGFHYDSPYASVFEALDLEIDASWKTGLVGRNGRGKTTLLGLVRKQIQPQRGRVAVPFETTHFPLLPPTAGGTTLDVVRSCVAPFRQWEAEMQRLLDAADSESLEAYGALAERYERLGGYDVDDRIEREFARLGMGRELLARRFDTLSGGESTRALVVPLFLREGVFPLIDEPTNHLDAAGRECLGDYLSSKRGFLLVSHDRALLDQCVDHVVAINRSDVRVHSGGFASWQTQEALERESERRRRANLSREVKAMKRAARERRDWSGKKEKQKQGAYDKGYIGHRAAKQMKRALHIERRTQERVDEKQQLLRNQEKERLLRLVPEERQPDTLIRLDGGSVALDGHPVLDGVGFRVGAGERVAIVGPNGCGKSTLLRVLAGELSLDTGVLERRRYLAVARAYQTPRWSRGVLREHLRGDGIEESRFRGVMGVLGVEGDVFERDLATFSEGERKKVDLCRSFLGSAHLWLWDEPMNYLDIPSREQIERAVLDYEPTLVFVDHDRTFVEQVATRVVEMT